MKKSFIIGLLVLVMVFAAHLAHSDFYVIPTGGAGMVINSLPYTISSPGFYYLKTNLTATGTGITVNANDVTIDLMGFCISGPGAASGSNYGIRINSDKINIEIRNGTIREFGLHGISATTNTIKGVRVLNIRAYSNGSGGISLAPVRGSRVQGCNAAYNGGRGINVGYAAIVAENIVNDNAASGIHVDYPGGVITGNTAYGNALDGIRSAAGATVTNNTAYFNTENGFRLDQCTTVKNNTAYNNGLYGFDLNWRCTVYNNTAYGNSSGNLTGCTDCQMGENFTP